MKPRFKIGGKVRYALEDGFSVVYGVQKCVYVARAPKPYFLYLLSNNTASRWVAESRLKSAKHGLQMLRKINNEI